MPVDDSFWDEESEALMRILFDHFKEATEAAQRAGINLVEEMAGVPVGVDWDFANEHAIQWAIEQSARTAAYVSSTSMEAFASKFPDWAASGAPLDDLIAELEPYYGKSRAAAVAVTETTNAFAKGNMMGWEATGVVDEYDFMIAEDELVCPICRGTRDNGPYALDDVDNAPALHVYCRCWLQPRVNTAALATRDTIADEQLEQLEQFVDVNPVAMRNAFDSWRKDLDDFEKEAISNYCDGTYSELNWSLRKGIAENTWDDELKDTHSGMWTALQKSKGLPQDTMLYRGIDTGDMYNAFAEGKIYPGDVIPDNAWCSTTVSKNVVERRMMYIIEAPKGTRGFFVGYEDLNSGYWDEEDEFVLAPGTRMQVKNIVMNDLTDTLEVFMRIIT